MEDQHLSDDDIQTVGSESGGAAPSTDDTDTTDAKNDPRSGDTDGTDSGDTDGTDSGDTDGTDSGDTEGTDSGDTDGTDSGDSDGTDA